MDEFLTALTYVAKAMRAAADDALQRHGVYIGQNLLMDALVVRDAQSPGELGARLGLSTPTVVKMAQRMEAVGLVERHRDKRDRRLVGLYLTPAGRQAQQRATEELDALSARATASLTPSQRADTTAALLVVLAALTEA